MKKTIIMVLAAAMVLTACNDEEKKQALEQQRYAEQQERNEYTQQSPQVVYAPPTQAPVIINQQPAHSGVADALVAGAAGYAIGSAMNNRSSDRGYDNRNNYNDRTYRSTNKTTVINNYNVTQPKQVRSSQYYGSTSKSYSSSTPKRSVYSKVFKSSSAKRR